MSLLKEYIRQVLQEKQRFAKETGKKFNEQEELVDWLETIPEAEREWTFIHYSDMPKLGINPKNKTYQTPLGIYGWNLKYYGSDEMVIGNVPFMGNSRYMFVFQVKPEFRDKIWNLRDAFEGQHYSEIVGAVDSPRAITKQLLSKGIYGIVDFSEGIYEGEPGQGVFFSTRHLDILKMVDRIPRTESDPKLKECEAEIRNVFSEKYWRIQNTPMLRSAFATYVVTPKNDLTFTYRIIKSKNRSSWTAFVEDAGKEKNISGTGNTLADAMLKVVQVVNESMELGDRNISKYIKHLNMQLNITQEDNSSLPRG